MQPSKGEERQRYRITLASLRQFSQRYDEQASSHALQPLSPACTTPHLISQELSLCVGELASNGYPVFECEMDAPTHECVSTKGQPQRECDGVELLCVRRFCG